MPTISHAAEKQTASYEVALGKRQMESTKRAAVRDKTKFVQHAKSQKRTDQSYYILTGNYVSFAAKKSIYGEKVNRTKKPTRFLLSHPRCTTKGSAWGQPGVGFLSNALTRRDLLECKFPQTPKQLGLYTHRKERRTFVTKFDQSKLPVISLPLPTFIDGFSLHRNV